MNLTLAYLAEARVDLDDVYSEYERVRSGLGERFLQAFRKQLDRILKMPNLYGVVHRDIRACPIRRWPYVLYYRVETARIVIIAVRHGRRGDSSWQTRT